MVFLKNRLPLIVTFVAGIIVVAQHYTNIPSVDSLASELLRWNVILAAFALVLGIGGIVQLHTGRIRRGGADAIYSVICLVSLVVFLVIGAVNTTTGKYYQWLWDYILLPVQSTTYATTFFFISSAAYRAFRIKSAYAVVLMVAAILTMTKVGLFAALMPITPKIASWIWDIPNTAAMRAVVVGSALSLVGNSFRILLGFERGHLGGGGE